MKKSRPPKNLCVSASLRETKNEDGKPALVPKLRFPEFRDGRPWSFKKIGEMLEEVARPIEMLDDEMYSLVTVKRRYGGVVPREQLTGSAIKVKSQFIVRPDDFLISKRQIVHDACGVVPADLNGAIVSNEYSVLRARQNTDIRFFGYFSQQPAVSESFLTSSVGIVIEKMLFKLPTWLRFEFSFPSLAEQQKIAECLSSVDELMAARSRKVDALKTHKKGLMQQLFPSGKLKHTNHTSDRISSIFSIARSSHSIRSLSVVRSSAGGIGERPVPR